jgi:hypothetical protein
MRTAMLVVLLVALAGCATAPPAPGTPAKGQASDVPTTSPAKPTDGAPAEGTPETPVFSFNRTFSASSAPFATDFAVAKAGWLCIDANITRVAGDAAITVLDPSGNPTTIASTRDGTLHNETILANDFASTWHVRIDVSGFTGEIGLNVSQMG